MNKYPLPLLFLFLFHFSSELHAQNSPAVEYHGALRVMMHQGDISARADLSDVQKLENLYGLGAFENLKGEIQIFGGKPYHTTVDADKNELRFDRTFSGRAALFVYAEVEEWQPIQIPGSVSDYEELEKFIFESAEKKEIDTDSPFPFLVVGEAKSLDWHVIDWPEGDTEHTHEKHKTSGLYGTLNNRAVHILGFYSNSHHGIFTHHSTNMHLHFKTEDGKLAGHLDDLIPGNKMILKLPAL